MKHTKVMVRQKIDLVPVVSRDDPNKVVGILTSESVAYAYEKAKILR
ncbi:MAG: hypothetical protein QXF45_07890 [Candidatus Caldarchaeum sp.]